MQRAVIFAVLLVPSLVFGWGKEGHVTIANVGSQLARTGLPFWKANVNNMMMLTEVPDAVWKSLPTNALEKPTHFFQPDSYFNDPSQFNQIPEAYSQCVAKWGKNFVDVNGTSVWRAQQFYNLAVAAIRRGDFKTGLEMAGVMSHYIGDMSQPLHDTKNFDGQFTGQTGIHFFFESQNIQAANQQQLLAAVGQQATALLSNAQFLNDFKGSLGDAVFREVARAYKYKDMLLSIDKQQGRTGAGAASQLKLAEARIADGAATLAVILSHLWSDAGNPQNGMTVSVEVPQWVVPSYPLQSKMQSAMLTCTSAISEADDCM